MQVPLSDLNLNSDKASLIRRVEDLDFSAPSLKQIQKELHWFNLVRWIWDFFHSIIKSVRWSLNLILNTKNLLTSNGDTILLNTANMLSFY